MTIANKTAPFGLWESDVEIHRAVDRSVTPSYPFSFHSKYYWLESLPEEQGRMAMVRYSNNDNKKEIITPSGFSVRSRVHEYGGKCFCVYGSWLVFNNYFDNSLYCQNLETNDSPELLFSEVEISGCCGFADIISLEALGSIVLVGESEEESSENRNFLLGISFLETRGRGKPTVHRYTILSESSDFCSSPAVSPNYKNITWLEWNHPHMPWDQTQLKLAKIEFNSGQLNLGKVESLVFRNDTSVFQPGFLFDGSVIFISDSPDSDYWNFFRYAAGKTKQITDNLVEYGEAQWLFGQSRWVEIKRHFIHAIETSRSGDRIVEINIDTGQITGATEEFAQLGDLCVNRSGVVTGVAGFSDQTPKLLTYEKLDSVKTVSGTRLQSVNSDSFFKRPKHLSFASGSDDIAYGYFYQPQNSNYQLDGETNSSLKPPLIVTIHGGPTARATAEYNGLKHYFCSLGFAVLDVNHRGSTGLGRKFRQSLLGRWGIYDVEDVAAGIEHVIKKGWVNENQIFIRGSSAGGYAVLRALTKYPDMFCGGASYYGIGNLLTLSEITHKFESHYTDQLVGEKFSSSTANLPDSQFVTRSPIYQIHRIAAPMIIFQGSDDRIVPPELANEIVDGLKRRKVPHQYIEYEGEGHGFRKPENRADALYRETRFYQNIIRNMK